MSSDRSTTTLNLSLVERIFADENQVSKGGYIIKNFNDYHGTILSSGSEAVG